jgi:hypothetical protein
MRNLIILMICICFIGCSTKPNISYKKEDINRVFMHEPGLYSILNIKFESVSFRTGYNWRLPNIEIIADVPKDKSMWYEGEYIDVKDSKSGWKWVKIHIHSPQDINGGAWNKRIGKNHFVLVQTTIIASNNLNKGRCL